MDKRRLLISGALVILLLSVASFYLYKRGGPRRTAEAYLNAARSNDLEKLKRLSYPTHWSGIAANGVAIRPEAWKFTGEKKIYLRKKEFDLSLATYKKEVSSTLYLYNEPFVDKLPSERLKGRLASFEAWRSENINTNRLFEENGRFYYNDTTPRVEFAVEVTAGPGNTAEYLLALEQKSSGRGKWEVTEFTKR